MRDKGQKENSQTAILSHLRVPLLVTRTEIESKSTFSAKLDKIPQITLLCGFSRFIANADFTFGSLFWCFQRGIF